MYSYNIYQFGRMIGDKVRMNAYFSALRDAVTPGCSVIDLGAGTGICTLLACRFGAGCVYALESDDAIHVARAMIRENGFQDQVQFVQGDSREFDPPEMADVLVSDLRGVLPLFGEHLSTIIDARERLLKRDGIQIPLKDDIYVAVAEAEDIYRRYTTPWGHNDYGFDFSAARRLLINSWVRTRVASGMLMSRPMCCATLDYSTIDNAKLSARSILTIERDGVAHGISAWFDAVLAQGIGFSNGPDAPELGYSMAFFPWEEPVDLEQGDRVDLKIDVRPRSGDYAYSWTTRIMRGRHQRAFFQQSTLFSSPLLLRVTD